jgi:chaperonin GroEL (HSP60 family)
LNLLPLETELEVVEGMQFDRGETPRLAQQSKPKPKPPPSRPPRPSKAGEVNKVSYKFPKPGPDKTAVPKVSFVTAVAGLGCGVGYYK